MIPLPPSGPSRAPTPSLPDYIINNLCWHDPRSASYIADMDPEDRSPPRVDCACDPCFYGRDRLALLLIERDTALAALLSEARTARTLTLALARAVLAAEKCMGGHLMGINCHGPRVEDVDSFQAAVREATALVASSSAKDGDEGGRK